MSPTVILIFGIISPKPCRRCIWIILSTLRRRYIIFDDDLGHGNHSGELLLFVGCIVNFVVSYLICMFQDSVPAGSYNDPFLSSVCLCVCLCVYMCKHVSLRVSVFESLSAYYLHDVFFTSFIQHTLFVSCN